MFRKARQLALELDASEAIFLTHRSYIDTTQMMRLDEYAVEAALADEDRLHGPVSPTLRLRIQGAAQSHNTLTDDEMTLILS